MRPTHPADPIAVSPNFSIFVRREHMGCFGQRVGVIPCSDLHRGAKVAIPIERIHGVGHGIAAVSVAQSAARGQLTRPAFDVEPWPRQINRRVLAPGAIVGNPLPTLSCIQS